MQNGSLKQVKKLGRAIKIDDEVGIRSCLAILKIGNILLPTTLLDRIPLVYEIV